MSSRHETLRVFAVFAAGYWLSSALRGITATLAPSFVQTFQLGPAALGVLGGAYFLGFALMQLPAGVWLDRYGSRHVLAAALAVAALGCSLFALADSFAQLVWGRFASGVGVSACLIAPLTTARLCLPPSRQQQVNLWLLMVGSLGLLAATLPAQMVAHAMGWRLLFAATALGFVVVIVAVLVVVPHHRAPPSDGQPWFRLYAPVFRSPQTWKMAPLGFFNYGILVAVQTLWAGPWLTEVSGMDANEAAWGLLGINVIMSVVFLGLGFLTPRLVRSAAGAYRVLRLGLPLSLLALAWIPLVGADAGWLHFAGFCAASATLSLTHPAVGQAAPAELAGRSIAFFNLLLFVGVFAAQWGVGAVIAAVFAATGDVLTAYRAAFGVLCLLSAAGYAWFVSFDRLFMGLTGQKAPSPALNTEST